jgi:hypothetical protein
MKERGYSLDHVFSKDEKGWVTGYTLPRIIRQHLSSMLLGTG